MDQKPTCRVVELRSIDDLAMLERSRAGRPRTHFCLRIPGLAPTDAMFLQQALTARYNECGCGLGAAFVLSAAACSLAMQLVPAAAVSPPWLAARTLVAMLLAGALGKWAGTRIARVHVRAIAAQIRDLVV